jgi:ABC-type branched-subunit amino acid transport system ATPase component
MQQLHMSARAYHRKTQYVFLSNSYGAARILKLARTMARKAGLDLGESLYGLAHSGRADRFHKHLADLPVQPGPATLIAVEHLSSESSA